MPEPETVTRQGKTRLSHRAELDIAEEDALKNDVGEKSRESTEQGSELHAKAQVVRRKIN